MKAKRVPTKVALGTVKQLPPCSIPEHYKKKNDIVKKNDIPQNGIHAGLTLPHTLLIFLMSLVTA